MKMHTRMRTALACAAGLALSMPAAFATASAVSSGAAVTNVQFHVVDLTPDDGQAGGITYYRRESSLSAVAGNVSDDKDYNDWRAASVYSNSGTALATMTQSGVPGETQTHAEVSGADSAAAFGLQEGAFWLTPHTSITMSGHVAGFVQANSGLDYAKASSFLVVYLYDENQQRYLSEVRKDLNLDSDHHGAAYDEDFTLSYANNTDAAIALQWTNYQYIYAATTDPVPEPEGYAMLAAGLLLLGAVARRRKAAQR